MGSCGGTVREKGKWVGDHGVSWDNSIICPGLSGSPVPEDLFTRSVGMLQGQLIGSKSP